MIVSDKNVSDALTFLAQGGAADAEAAFLAAERARERRGAEIFLSTEGSVKEREMRVLVDTDHQMLQANEDTAKAELTRAKSRAAGADKICSIWQTENANARAAERVR
jgi:hypothetical protein